MTYCQMTKQIQHVYIHGQNKIMNDKQIRKYVNDYFDRHLERDKDWLDHVSDAIILDMYGELKLTNECSGTSDIFTDEFEKNFIGIGLNIYHERYDSLYAIRDANNSEREIASYEIPNIIAEISRLNMKVPRQRYLEAISKLKEVIQILK